MLPVSMSDKARSFQLQQANSQLKRALGVLTQEVSTGKVADVSTHLRGNLMSLGTVENRLSALESYKASASEGAMMAQAMQATFEGLHDIALRHTTGLIDAGNTSSPGILQTTVQAAAADFAPVIAQLNLEVAGRHVFGGTRSDVAPLADKDSFLNTLRTEVAGLPTAGDVLDAINAWFDAPEGDGGFLDTVFAGRADSPLSQRIGAQESVSFETSAASAEVKALLKGLAISSLVADGSIGTSHAERTLYASEAGKMIAGADVGLISQQGRLGSIEENIERTQTRYSAEATSLGIARNSLIGTDPYETAQELKTVELQLESLYAVTARLSRLSLTNYL